MPGRPWRLHPSSARFVTSPRIGYASRPNRAIDGRGLSPPRSAALLAAPIKNDPDLSPKTRERYLELAEFQIIPHLGTTRLQKLKPKQVDDWHKTLLKAGAKTGGPLSARTVGHAHRVLHRALQIAVENEVLARNVASA